MPAQIADSTEISLQFASFHSGGALDTAAYAIVTHSPCLAVVSVIPADDGVLSPGEATTLLITLRNNGSTPMQAANVELVSDSGWVATTTATASLAALTHGASASLTPAIEVTADSDMIDGIADNLTLTIIDGYFEQIVKCPVLIGQITSSAFGGPDPYGYYCYDDTDIESERAPGYYWRELIPAYGGSGTSLPLGDDETAIVPLPFTFIYYGIPYDSISICSNGWIALGEIATMYYLNFYNRPLPDPGAPPAMICPFWDDIDPAMPECGVYYQYIESDSTFIVEWRAVNTFDDTTIEWFEVILRDPAFWYFTTPTGDGEIVFQYKQIADIDTQIDADDIAEYSTVGIEEPNKVFGFQYCYCNIYEPHAAPLANHRAIRWTTMPPEAIYAPVREEVTNKPQKTTLYIAPNPFNPSLIISVELAVDAHLRIEILDISGRMIRTIADDMRKNGTYRFVWNGKDDSSKPMPSGIYFVKMTTPQNAISKKATLLR